jgi:hypothetical protein
MKKHIYPFKGFVLLAFALTPLLSMAIGGENVEKKRTISKTYSVSSSDKLSIENSFGNVVVSTWDKDEIQVDVEIGVRASSEEKAQQMLDQIKVTDKQSGQLIFFKTDIGNMGNGKENKNYDGNDRRFYIDYKISMPSRNPLSIENSFGKVNIPDFAGSASLTSKFGELTTGKLAGAKLVQVEFGRADIGVLNNADVVFKFNSRSNIAGLGGNTKIHVEFCSQVNLTLDNSLTELSLSESYSSINLKAPSNLSAHFDVYTNFGSFKNRTGFNIAEDKDDDFSGPKFDKNYSGSAGNGAAKIKIKSSFGTVRVVNVDDKTNDKEEVHKDKDNDKDDEKVDL